MKGAGVAAAVAWAAPVIETLAATPAAAASCGGAFGIAGSFNNSNRWSFSFTNTGRVNVVSIKFDTSLSSANVQSVTRVSGPQIGATTGGSTTTFTIPYPGGTPGGPFSPGSTSNLSLLMTQPGNSRLDNTVVTATFSDGSIAVINLGTNNSGTFSASC